MTLVEQEMIRATARDFSKAQLAAMTEFLKLQKLAAQYIPERLIVRDAMPATPSGKIQKFRLREMLRDG
ncbi:hypothetical protein [Bradyrhizobium sp.]|uniref:hypothetical protein n=1 Tax=Bradyrhizobium sp. TaxID=376 RepID=UPI003C7534FA